MIYYFKKVILAKVDVVFEQTVDIGTDILHDDAELIILKAFTCWANDIMKLGNEPMLFV